MRNFFAVVFGWPAALFVVVLLWGLAREAGWFPGPPPAVPRPAEVRARSDALLTLVGDLAPAERAAFDAALETHLLPLDRWLLQRRPHPGEVLCVGEEHRDSTRAFIASHLLPALAPDRLLLEHTPQRLQRLVARVDAGESPVALLDADIAAVVHAARKARPGVTILGIDERPAQRRRRLAAQISELRDVSILDNLAAVYRTGRHHLVLFGALHCGDREGWLFHRLVRRAPRPPAGYIANLRVVDAAAHLGSAAFSRAVSKLGYRADALVIADPRALPALVYEALPQLVRDWRAYQAVVVFR